MDKDIKVDISELIQLMFVGLMGANNEINKVLKAFHEGHDKPSHGFLFYEFFGAPTIILKNHLWFLLIRHGYFHHFHTG